MKMKKLTALALAGVLCLGMSTTAFAAKSPVPADAANEKDKGKVTSDDYDSTTGGTFVNKWEIKKGESAEDASKRIQYDIEDWIKGLEREIEDTDSKAVEEHAKKALDELKKLEGSELQLVTTADITYTGADKDDRDFSKNPVTVRFDLSGRGVKPGDRISVMHQVYDEKTNSYYWTVLTDVEVQEYKDENDPSKNMYYVDYDFTSFSNVVLLKQLSDGSGDVIPSDPDEKPDNPNNPDNPNLTPDENGNITADQLADLIVKKIQERENATKVVRTAVSGKASPKTGE